MKSLELFEAFTVIGFGFFLTAFVVGEILVTWRRELRRCRCGIRR